MRVFDAVFGFRCPPLFFRFLAGCLLSFDQAAKLGLPAWTGTNESVERLERELNTYRQELIILEQERDTLLAERTQLEARCQEYVSRLHVQHQGKGRLLELLRRELVGLHQVANAN